MTTRYNPKVDWESMWEEDRKSILDTMYRNMMADLDCGYDPMGYSIQKQKQEISEFEKRMFDAWFSFVSMTEEQVNKWCFYDLKKRGAIE